MAARRGDVVIDVETVNEIEYLIASGTPAHDAAARIGWRTSEAMRRALRRGGRLDLWVSLRNISHERGLTVRGECVERRQLH